MLRAFFVPSELEKKRRQLFIFRSNEPHPVCSTAREFNKMGLFDALPPLVSSAKVKVKEDDDDDDETRHTEKKRKIE